MASSSVNRLHAFDCRDVSLAADFEGNETSQPVILLHGGGQNRHSWRTARRSLADAGYLAVTVDLRGHGDSDRAPAGDYRLDSFANDVRAVAAAFERPPVLVGASLGGVSAAVAIGEKPFLTVAGLVLVDVAHRPVVAGAQRIRRFMTQRPEGYKSLEEAAAAIAAYLPHRPRPSIEAAERSLRERDGRWHWHWDPAFVIDGRPNSLTLEPARIGAALAAIDVPALLIRGGSSEIVSPDIAAEFRSLMPHAHYVDIPGATHMVAGDDNDVFNQALTGFLVAHCPPGNST